MTPGPLLGRFSFFTVGKARSSPSSSVSAGLDLPCAGARGSLIAAGALAVFFFGGLNGAGSASFQTASDEGVAVVRG
jgi:hypothetical protein